MVLGQLAVIIDLTMGLTELLVLITNSTNILSAPDIMTCLNIPRFHFYNKFCFFLILIINPELLAFVKLNAGSKISVTKAIIVTRGRTL